MPWEDRGECCSSAQAVIWEGDVEGNVQERLTGGFDKC